MLDLYSITTLAHRTIYYKDFSEVKCNPEKGIFVHVKLFILNKVIEMQPSNVYFTALYYST